MIHMRTTLATVAISAPDAPNPQPVGDLEPALKTARGALFQGDCLEILPHIPTGSVDCVFADPPFNLGKDYGSTVDDERARGEYLAWTLRWADELVRVLAPGGSLFIYNLPKWNTHMAAHLDGPLTFRHWVAIDMKVSLPVAGRLYPAHYSLLYFVKGKRPARFAPPRLPLATCRHCGGELRDYGGYKDRMNPNGVNLSDVWTDISPVRHSRYKNRTANELSLKLMDRVLDIATAPGDLVLDPFAGAGTTLIAAELKDRHWLGIEIADPDPIVRRFADLPAESAALQRYQATKNQLWTEEALKLRAANGHKLGRFRLLEGQGEQLALGD
jgi:site-specific DNA-methyltransferase (adenine-specific)